jgi:hypothetical protein
MSCITLSVAILTRTSLNPSIICPGRHPLRSGCGHPESLINKTIQNVRSILLFEKDFVTVENRLAIPGRSWSEALNVSKTESR